MATSIHGYMTALLSRTQRMLRLSISNVRMKNHTNVCILLWSICNISLTFRLLTVSGFIFHKWMGFIWSNIGETKDPRNNHWLVTFVISVIGCNCNHIFRFEPFCAILLLFWNKISFEVKSGLDSIGSFVMSVIGTNIFWSTDAQYALILRKSSLAKSRASKFKKHKWVRSKLVEIVVGKNILHTSLVWKVREE